MGLLPDPCASAGRVFDLQAAVECSTRSRSPRSPARAGRRCHAVVGDLDRHPAVRTRDLDRDARGVCVLCDVRECLARDEVDRCLDGVGQPLRTDAQLDWHRRTPASGEGGGEAFLGEDRGWMPRARARSSARASTTSASASARSSSTDVPPSASRPRASWSASRIPSRRCCAPSWRSRSTRRRSASPASTMRAGRRAPRELGAQLGLQARVLEREARCCAHRLDELGIVEERG